MRYSGSSSECEPRGSPYRCDTENYLPYGVATYDESSTGSMYDPDPAPYGSGGRDYLPYGATRPITQADYRSAIGRARRAQIRHLIRKRLAATRVRLSQVILVRRSSPRRPARRNSSRGARHARSHASAETDGGDGGPSDVDQRLTLIDSLSAPLPLTPATCPLTSSTIAHLAILPVCVVAPRTDTEIDGSSGGNACRPGWASWGFRRGCQCG